METAVSASLLLQVWEQARSQTPVQRALTLLALAVPAESAGTLTGFSIGRRDQALLGLRERLFGSRMTGAAHCPVCAESVEADFAVADIRTEPAPDPAEPRVLQLDGYELRFRLPNCDDLASLDSLAGAPENKSALLKRCVTDARLNGAATLVEQLPETVVSALSVRMAELDPQGDIQLALTCPRCAHHWVSSLDIGSYLWSEIQAWAVRMLRDVHTLARAYGWRESDILALSPTRRQAYLEMIQS